MAIIVCTMHGAKHRDLSMPQGDVVAEHEYEGDIDAVTAAKLCETAMKMGGYLYDAMSVEVKSNA